MPCRLLAVVPTWLAVLAGIGCAGDAPQATDEQPRPESTPAATRRGGGSQAGLRNDPRAYYAHTDAVSREELLDLYAATWHPDYSGQLALHLRAGHYILEDQSATSSDQKKRGFHLSAYDRERHVPLLVYVPGDPAPGRHQEPVSLESIGATLFDLLELPRPEAVTAPALQVPLRGKPRVIVVLVLDALPYALWDSYLSRQPHFSRLRASSQEYVGARLAFMSSSTTVSHAVLSTGLPPRYTGIPINHTRTAPGQYTEVFVDQDPSRLLVPTVADLYDLAHDNQPVVISFCSQSRAAIAMAGHGRSWPGGDADLVVWQQRYWGPFETSSEFYSSAPYLDEVDPEAYLDALEDRSFLSHRLNGLPALFRSPHNVIIGERAVSLLMEREGVGQDEITDLVFFNQKVLDNVAHRWGADGGEYRLCMDALDAFMGRFLDELRQRYGEEFALFVTSDHGFGPKLRRPDEGGVPARHQLYELLALLEERFGSPERPVFQDVQYLNVYLDEENLRHNGHSLAEVCRAFEELAWTVSCLTRDEILEHRGGAGGPS